LGVIEHPDLVQKIWGRYLRFERRFDAWSGQGKLLVLIEILLEEGYDIRQLVTSGVDFQKLVNLVFPRTFFSLRKPISQSRIIGRVVEYYREEKFVLSLQGLDPLKIRSLALEETACKFDLPEGQVDKILKCFNDEE